MEALGNMTFRAVMVILLLKKKVCALSKVLSRLHIQAWSRIYFGAFNYLEISIFCIAKGLSSVVYIVLFLCAKRILN